MITQMFLDNTETEEELPPVKRNSKLGTWLNAHADREGMKKFYVQGEILYSPWIKGAGYKFLVRHLIEPVRVVLGLWDQSQQRIALSKKAAMAGLNPGEFIALNRILYESDIAAVKFCKAYGLPASASVYLSGYTMYCKTCNATLGSLPCVHCWSGIEDDPSVGDMDQTPYEQKLRTGRPTQHLPGTPEKVEVLRQRVERGYHLWHPKDRTEIDSMLEKLRAIIDD